jgi:ribosome recycling factor
MLEEVYSATKEKMSKSIESLKNDYKTLRTGKVNTSVLDNIKVDYYGTPTALSGVATVLTTDATTISVTPWEKNMVAVIDKAIAEANIGVNPTSDGESVKLFFPPMTTEQREQTVKQAKVMTDNAKVAIRNIRKDSNNKVKALLKDKEITEDDNKKALDNIQKTTDSFIASCDDILKTKEAEILKV